MRPGQIPGEQDQDELSVAQAYEAYAPELRRYAATRLRDIDAAEDVVQEAFVRLAVESGAWRGPANQRAWLYRVVLNLIISGARRAEVARRRSNHLALEDVVLQTPEMEYLASERHRALGAALASTGAAGQTGLVLAAQGYSGREIARVLGRSEGATRTLICRARSQVRHELTASYAEVA